MAQQVQKQDPVATLHGLFPGYQAPVSPMQVAQQGFQTNIPQTKFMPPGHVRPNMTGFTPGQASGINALSAENLPYVLQSLGGRR